MRARTALRSKYRSLFLLLLLPLHAHAWTVAKGYSDTWNATQGGGAPGRIYIPAAGCVVSTAASNWDLYSVTDPTPTCITGAAGGGLKKGVLTFNNAGTTCTSTTATTGCAFTTVQIPTDFPTTGQINARILFTSTDTTSGHTIIWKLSTVCKTPWAGGSGGVIDDPTAFNAADTLTYTVGASGEVSASLRIVSKASITMTGCTGGDLLHVRIGRDTADTATDNINFIGLELTILRNM
jgi:hypothetical protein